MRRSALAAALVAGAAVLTACGSQPAVSEAAATGTATSSATGGTAATTDELRDALLPAAAFGADATVVGLSLEQLGDLPDLAGLPEGSSVQPALCGAALSMLPTAPEELPTLVAEGAFTRQTRTLQVLAEGPGLDGLELPVDQLLAACSTVTLTGSDGAVATVTLAALDLPDLGDATAGLQVTVASPEGSVSALVGVVSTGPRALLLAQTGAAGADPDPTAFTDLLTDAASD